MAESAADSSILQEPWPMAATRRVPPKGRAGILSVMCYKVGDACWLPVRAGILRCDGHSRGLFGAWEVSNMVMAATEGGYRKPALAWDVMGLGIAGRIASLAAF